MSNQDLAYKHPLQLLFFWHVPLPYFVVHEPPILAKTVLTVKVRRRRMRKRFRLAIVEVYRDLNIRIVICFYLSLIQNFYDRDGGVYIHNGYKMEANGIQHFSVHIINCSTNYRRPRVMFPADSHLSYYCSHNEDIPSTNYQQLLMIARNNRRILVARHLYVSLIWHATKAGVYV